MIERRIKELSIALEALSRIHTAHEEGIYESVRMLLARTIHEATEKPTATNTPTPGLIDDIAF